MATLRGVRHSRSRRGMVAQTRLAARSVLTQAASACIALGALCATGCGDSTRTPGSSAPPRAAHAAEERVLHVYNWSDYIGRDTLADFERETGIEVVYDFYDSNEMLETKLLTGDTGYDIVSTTTGYYGRQIKAGAYEPLDKTRLPNWKNLDPYVLGIQGRTDPGNRHAAPYLHAMNGYAYNVDLVAARMRDAPLDSLDMLFKPEVVAKFADCGVSFLDSPDDVLQLALTYLHLDPNSRRARTWRPRSALPWRYGRTFVPLTPMTTSISWPQGNCASRWDGPATIRSPRRGRAPRASTCTSPLRCPRKARTSPTTRC
jgi:spermidine/putrescine-binding protein